MISHVDPFFRIVCNNWKTNINNQSSLGHPARAGGKSLMSCFHRGFQGGLYCSGDV